MITFTVKLIFGIYGKRILDYGINLYLFSGASTERDYQEYKKSHTKPQYNNRMTTPRYSRTRIIAPP